MTYKFNLFLLERNCFIDNCKYNY